ncbi:MAG: hypothetical protein ACI9JK_001725, partial [Phycisphaerales bacterium]
YLQRKNVEAGKIPNRRTRAEGVIAGNPYHEQNRLGVLQ